MTESDKKAVEEFLRIWDRRSAFNANDMIRDETVALIIKTRQETREEERQRILDLPCMQAEKCEPVEALGDIGVRNDLRREIRDALNKK